MDNGIRKSNNILFNQIYSNGMNPLNKRGQQMVVSNKEGLSSKLVQEKKDTLLPEEEGKYNKILTAFNMPAKEELLQALKILDTHGLNLSKENLTQFLSTKNQLNELVKGLDHSTALELMKKDVDLETDTIEEVVEQIEEAKKEEKSFSFRRFLRSLKSMSTDEAEGIAKELYGNKQGKDITDIIKALHKSGMEISKKNIDRVNDVFNKLHNIKDYSDEGLVEVVKNKVEANIDHLYKMKNSIKRGAIAVEEKLSHYATKVYDSFNGHHNKPTERDLKLLEEDISGLLKREGLETTKEIIDLAKSLIKHGLEVSKENIVKVQEMKYNLHELVKVLDKEKIALLLNSGFEVEKEKIGGLLKLVKELETLGADAKGLKETPLKTDAKISYILDKITKLGEVTDEELLTLLNKGQDFKLGDIHKIEYTNRLNNMTAENRNGVYYGTVKMVGLLNDEIQRNFKEMNFIRSNITASMVATGVEKGLQLEKMELGQISNFINDFKMTKGNWQLINSLPQIQKQGENILALLMKNDMPINLMEMKQVSHFMKNEFQIGHHLQAIFEHLEKEAKYSLKGEIAEMKLRVKEMSDEIKNGKLELNRYSQEMSKLLKSLEGMGTQLESKAREELYKGLNRLTETIETQNQLNQKDTTVQLPIMMDQQIKNLQIYIMKDNHSNKKIDPKKMSVLLNMDTNTMGNINVYLGVNYKQLTLKVGVKYKENQELLESNIPTLKGMLAKIGYEIKDISFKVDEDLHLMTMVEEIAEKQKTVKHSIDMMI